MSSSKLNLVVNFQGQDGLSGTLKNIVGLGKSGGAALRGLGQDARKADRDLKEYRKTMSAATGNVTALIDKETQLEKKLADVNAQIDRQKRLSAIDSSVGAMHQRGDAMQQRGRDNVMGGASMLAPFVLAGKAALDYDKQLTSLAQKTDMGAEAQRRFGNDIMAVATATNQLPSMMMGAANFLAGKGLKDNVLSGMLPTIGRFGTAFEADVNDTAKAAYANYLSLKVPLSETAKALEIMGSAGLQGGFEVKDMAKEVPILASQYAAFGGTGLSAVGQLSSALQVLEAKTGDGAIAANQLDNMMRFALSNEGIKNFSKFGIDIPAQLKKAVAEGRDPLETIATLTAKATGGDTSKLGQIFTDAQASAGMRGMIQSLEEYRAIRDKALSTGGLTDKEFTRMSKSAGGNWTAMQGSLQGLAVVMGTHLLPLLTSGVQWITKTTNSIAAWAQANPETASTLMQIIVGIGAFRVGLGALQFTFGGILKPMASVWGFFKKTEGVSKFGTILSKLKTGFSAVGPVFTKAGQWFAKLGPVMMRGAGLAKTAFTVIRMGAMGLARGIMQAGMMMLANPVVLAIVAIVAAVGLAAYLIYTHWDTIKAAFWSAVAAIGQAMAAAKAWVVNGWNNVKAGFGAAITWLLGLHGRMLAIGKNIIQGIVSGILAAPGAVWNALKSVVTAGINGVKSLLDINSPSRVFMGIGGSINEGFAKGIDRSAKLPQKSMGNLAAMMGQMGAEAMAPGGDANRFDPRRRVVGAMAAGALAMTPMAPASAAAGRGAPASAGATYHVTIHINGAENKDARTLARDIKRELEALDATAARSSFEDAE